MRRLVLLLPLALIAVACGGSDRSEVSEPPAEQAEPPAVVTTLDPAPAEGAVPEWMQPYLAEQGPDVGLVYATSDYGAGENRVAFLVVDEEGALVQAPTAEVLYAVEGSDEPVTASASLVPVGPHTHPGGAAPHDHPDATDLYVATVEFPEAGRYWMIALPEGRAIQGLGAFDVRDETISPPVGSLAIASANPTVDEASAEDISTARPPHVELLRNSIVDSLEAGVPFVVVFATPAFCQSRTCGPTVDVVDQVRERMGDSDIRFIHVEIYDGNDPANGVNQWVEEWGLPTEPWVFLVGSDGVIREKFEGSVSVEELDAAVRANLL